MLGIHTADSKELEHGCRMIDAGCPSLLGLQLEDGDDVPTFWLQPYRRHPLAPAAFHTEVSVLEQPKGSGTLCSRSYPNTARWYIDQSDTLLQVLQSVLKPCGIHTSYIGPPSFIPEPGPGSGFRAAFHRATEMAGWRMPSRSLGFYGKACLH